MIVIFAPAIPADHPRLVERIARPLSHHGRDVILIMAAPFGGKVPAGLDLLECVARRRLSRIPGVLRASRSLLAVPDVSVVVCGGIEAWLVAVLLRPFRQWKVVFESSEDYPAAIQRWSSGRIARQVLSASVRLWIKILSRFSYAVILSRRSNSKDYRACPNLLFLLNAVPDPNLIRSQSRAIARRGEGDPLRVISAGLFSPERGSEILRRALYLIDQQLEPNSVELAFVGSFAMMDEEAYLKDVGSFEVVSGVVHVPWIEYETLMTEVLPEWHVGLALFQPLNDNLSNPMPNKVFDYMATGVVPLAPAWAEELNSVVDSESCLLVDTADAKAVSGALMRALGDDNRVAMAEAGLRLTRRIAEDSSFLAELSALLDAPA